MLSGAIGASSDKAAKGLGAMVALLLGSAGLAVTSIVDAVKNAKSEVKQIVPKEESRKVDGQV